MPEYDGNNDKMPNEKKAPSGIFMFLMFSSFLILILYIVGSESFGSTKKTFAEFEEMVKAKQIKKIVVKGDEVIATGITKKDVFYIQYPKGYFNRQEALVNLKELFLTNGGNAQNFSYEAPSMMKELLINMIPWILIFLVLWYFLKRQMRDVGGGAGVLSFGKSRAKRGDIVKNKLTFDDVAGIEEAKEEVREIIEFLKNPKRFQKLGGRMPRGVLLVGAPGTGKTLLAKAIAGEAKVPFYSICGSDFVEMFVGVGASRVRDLFKQAKTNAPCIIFLDEIDAVGRRRGTGLGGGHDEREQTLNAILVEMDGFGTDDGVIVMAATNRPDVLDPALLRPGRFDREIVIDLPDVKGRKAILEVHVKKIILSDDVDLSVIAKTTPTFSGAELEALINEAAIIAVMKDKDSVELEDLEEARDKVRWGRQKKNRSIAVEDKKITAIHESGHALIALVVPKAETLHKVTIIPRGMALGATMQIPEKDRYHMQKEYLLDMVTILFGGRAAEEVFCDDISAGAQNDIKRATDMVRSMVCEWGMSSILGPISYSENEEHLFLGREIARQRHHSEKTSEKIDDEIKTILISCYDKAKSIINENIGALEKITEALLKYEVLNGDEVRMIFDGGEIKNIQIQREMKNNNKINNNKVIEDNDGK